MRVLALETSGRVGSVALLEAAAGRTAVVAELAIPAAERTARALLPCVQRMLGERGWRAADLGLIATTTGPGSFTGLRIGVVAAKTISYATGAKLVGVHTLASMATNVPERKARLWTILDAQRQELFVACVDTDIDLAAHPSPVTEILAGDTWLNRLATGDMVLGPPLAKLQSRLPNGVVPVEEKHWQPSAAATGRLAIQLVRPGVSVPPLELVPHYYRKSAAEEKVAKFV